MKKRTVIINTPARLPFVSTVLYTFLLYYFKVDNLYWGIFITIYILYWIVALVLVFNVNKIDLDNDKISETKIKFSEKLQELINKK